MVHWVPGSAEIGQTRGGVLSGKTVKAPRRPFVSGLVLRDADSGDVVAVRMIFRRGARTRCVDVMGSPSALRRVRTSSGLRGWRLASVVRVEK